MFSRDLSFHKKKSFLIFSCLSLIFLSALFHLAKPDLFSTDFLWQNKTGSFFPFNYPKIFQITKHRLTYLGQGMQSIAFVSKDGQYVLKFFLKQRLYRKARIKPALFWNKFRNLPPNHPNSKLYVLKSYDKAFQALTEETGLAAVHLTADTQNLPFCRLQDEKGSVHVVDLNKAAFVIQKKGQAFPESFSQIAPDQKQKLMDKLQKLLEDIAKKGFVTHAKNFNPRNFALIGEKPIMIDVGNIQYSEKNKNNPNKERLKVISFLKKWVNEN